MIFIGYFLKHDHLTRLQGKVRRSAQQRGLYRLDNQALGGAVFRLARMVNGIKTTDPSWAATAI